MRRHTREIDHLGGLAKAMPWTAAAFCSARSAICGLPPLNGFVSEFLIYMGLFHTLGLGTQQAFPVSGVRRAGPGIDGRWPWRVLSRSSAWCSWESVVRPSRTPVRESGWLDAGADERAERLLRGDWTGIAFAAAPLLDQAIGVWTHQPAAASGALDAGRAAVATQPGGDQPRGRALRWARRARSGASVHAR